MKLKTDNMKKNYIPTKEGLTYVFIRSEEISDKEQEDKKGRTEMTWINVHLSGASNIYLYLLFMIFPLFQTFAQPTRSGPCDAVPLAVLSPGRCDVAANRTIGNCGNGIDGWIPSNFHIAPSCVYYKGQNDAWYSFIAPASGVVKIQSSNSAMTVYSNTGGCNGTFAEIACSDRSSTSSLPMLVAGGLVPGNTYFIRCWLFFTSGPGNFIICMEEGVPQASFTASSAIVCPQEPVIFTNLSPIFNSPTTWNWSFPGGTPSMSIAKDPAAVTYSTPGNYDVSLITSNAYGSDTILRPGYIEVIPPTAEFKASHTSVEEGCHTTFRGLSICEPESWNWSFPGGTPASSTLPNPTVRYNNPGVYDVTLTVTSAYGTVTQTVPGYIKVPGTPTSNTFNIYGTDFWFMIPQTIRVPDNSIVVNILSDVPTTGTIHCPGIGFSQSFIVNPTLLTTVVIPQAAAVGSPLEGIHNNSIHIVSNNPITVTAYNDGTSDGMPNEEARILPTGVLGAEYRFVSYGQSSAVGYCWIVATQNNTIVTIVPTSNTWSGHPVGLPFNIVLDQGELYSITGQPGFAESSLIGTKISADKPIAVFGGSTSTVPRGNEGNSLLYEQLLPLEYWGTEYIAVDLLGKTNPHNFFLIVANENHTEVSINGNPIARLNQGQYLDTLLPKNNYYITANKPIAVGEFGFHSNNDIIGSGIFMMLLLPASLSISSAITEIPININPSPPEISYVSVSTKTANTQQVLLDGVPFPGIWTPVPGSSYSVSSVPLVLGRHRLSSLGVDFNAYLYTLGAGGYGYYAGCVRGGINELEASITFSEDARCYGSNDGTATVTATGGTPPYSYSWSPSGGYNATATGLSAGTYIVTVVDDNCYLNTDTVVIGEPPPLLLSLSSSNISCIGENNGSATIIPTGGTAPYTYLWNTFPQQTDNSISGLKAGIYSVEVTDNAGCTATETVSITEPLPLILSTSVTRPSCNNSDGEACISVSGGEGPYSYLWNDGNNQNTSCATNIPSGIYHVTVTDLNNCIARANLILNDQGGASILIDSISDVKCMGGNDGAIYVSVSGNATPYSYSWTNNVNTKNNASLTVGTYYLTVTDANGCNTSDSARINEPLSLITANVNEITHVNCYGGNNGSINIDVNGGTGGYTYYWSNGTAIKDIANLYAGNYKLIVMDSNGCNDSLEATITEPEQAIVTISGEAAICEEESATLTASVSNGVAPYIFTWNPGTMNTSTATVSPSATTIYTVSVTDGNNCIAKPDSFTVTVHFLPTVSFMADPDSGCAPLCVLFSNNTPNTQTAAWNFGDGQTGTSFVITYCYDDPGLYSVELAVTDSNGCANAFSAPDLIHVFSNPVAGFNITPPQSAPVFSSVLFNDQSLSADQWLWNFGDFLNSTSILPNPAFIYTESGEYKIKLTVMNNEGCTDTVSHTIIIEPEFVLYIPNAFTPDNDELNDSFTPRGMGFFDFEMEIYNRWGEKIYYTNNTDKSWDGRAKGEMEISKQDVYVYKIWVKDFKEQVHYYVGNVTLIR